MQILVCAPTNVAVDNIAIKLGETEVKPLRLGHPTRIMNAAQKYSIDSCLQHDDGYVILQEIKRSIKVLEMNIKSEKHKNYKEIRDLNKEYKRRFNKLNYDILKKFPVGFIFCKVDDGNVMHIYICRKYTFKFLPRR